MSAMYPVSGAFSVFGTRFVSPALGFTLGKITLASNLAGLLINVRMELLVSMVGHLRKMSIKYLLYSSSCLQESIDT